MARKSNRKRRRTYSDDLKAEAVQMMLDGYTAESVAANLGISGTPLLYRWKAKALQQSGPAAASLDQRVRQLEEELRRVEREARHLKKSLGYFQPKDLGQRYLVIRQLEEEAFPVSQVCEILHVSRAAYYAWRQSEPSVRMREDDRLRAQIRRIFDEHRRRYGARRIAAELTANQQPCSRRRAGRLMKDLGLVAIQPRSFQPRTTDSRHTLGYSPNRLLDASPPERINQVWVGDITYVPLIGSGFLYLALLMDRCSRRIVGWDLQDHMQESLVIAALRAAIALRQPPPNMIHHTDRGGQYAGGEYRQMLARAGMLQSMSRAENCYDNAFMESCFGTLKNELEMKPYETAHAARQEIPAFVRYYNTRRRHSALGYLAPEAFEARLP